jgi:adenylate cyclase
LSSTSIFAVARVTMFVGLGLGVAAMAVIGYQTHALRKLELRTVDQRTRIRGARPAPQDVVVVGIDDETFDRLGVQWPFPRRFHARMLEHLAAARPRAIGFDVQFTESMAAYDDFRLRESVRAAGNVVLATTEGEFSTGTRGTRTSTKVLGGVRNQRRARTRVASGMLPAGPDDRVRSFQYDSDGLAGLAVATVARARGVRISRARFRADRSLYGDTDSLVGGETALIDFSGPARTLTTVPYWQVFEGRAPPELFRGKIVFIGATSPALQDVQDTPFGKVPGAEVQADAARTVLDGFPLQDAGRGLDIALIVALGLVAPVAALALRPRSVVVVTLVAGVGYLVAAQLAYDGGTVVPVVWPLTALLLGFLGALPASYVAAAFGRTRALFARYVPSAVADRAIENPRRGPSLGGELLEATVMFCDLRGFTSFAETLPPESVIEVLNRYLGEMSESILDHGGTLVSYSGDGIMAVFGAPQAMDDHADRALAAARQMSGERLDAFNAWLDQSRLGASFRMGVGLNSGPVVSGHVGSDRRLEYTCIGDTTNTAARLESMTKDTPHQVFLSAATRAALTRRADDLVALGEIEVRGRAHHIKVWALPARTPVPSPEPVSARG